MRLCLFSGRKYGFAENEYIAPEGNIDADCLVVGCMQYKRTFSADPDMYGNLVHR